MTESLAERAYRSAVQQWEGSGHVGPKPTREAFAHLEHEPDDVPAPSAVPAPVWTRVPAPLDADAQAALEQMRTSVGWPATNPGPAE